VLCCVAASNFNAVWRNQWHRKKFAGRKLLGQRKTMRHEPVLVGDKKSEPSGLVSRPSRTSRKSKAEPELFNEVFCLWARNQYVGM